MTPRIAAVALAAGALALLAACGDDDSSSSSSDTVTVTGQWARTSPADATNGAAYMVLTAAEDDALVGASVPSSVAGMVQLHETTMAGGDMSDTTMGDMSSTTMGDMSSATTMAGGGEMTMKEVDQIDLPAGEAVKLEPGGYHIMLMELAAPLKTGESITITLDFEKAPDLDVEVPVRDTAP